MKREKSNRRGSPVHDLLITEVADNEFRHQFRLGDITWIKMHDSWWPAQVADEESISYRPEKKLKDDRLVRLYGTCDYLYVDPWKCNVEFEIMLKQENKGITEAFKEALEKDLSRIDKRGKSEGEVLESKGDVASESPNDKMLMLDSTEQNQEDHEVAAGSSARKIRRPEGLKRSSSTNVKELATPEAPKDKGNRQDGGKQNQKASKIAKGTVVLQGRKQEGLRRSGHIHVKEPATGNVGGDDSPGASKDKRQKQDCLVQNQGATKMETTGTAVVKGRKREVLRRSSRINAKENLTEGDITSPLRAASASEDAIDVGIGASKGQYQHEEGSVPTGSTATDAEIRAMVREILFKGKIPRQCQPEKADTDEVSNGVLNVSNIKQNTSGKRKHDDCEEKVTDTGHVSAGTQRGPGIKRREDVVEGVEASNVTLGAREGKDDNSTPVKLKDMEEQEIPEVRDVAEDGFLNAQNQRKDGTDKSKRSNVDVQVIKRVYTRASKNENNKTRGAGNQDKAKSDLSQVKSTKDNGSKHIENGIAEQHPASSKDGAAEEAGHHRARQIRVMQSLALIAPSGSPFRRNGLVPANHLDL